MGRLRRACAVVLAAVQAALAGTMTLDAYGAYVAGAATGAVGLLALSTGLVAASIHLAAKPYRPGAWNLALLGVVGSTWLAFTGPFRDDLLALAGLAVAAAALATCWRSVPPEFANTPD